MRLPCRTWGIGQQGHQLCCDQGLIQTEWQNLRQSQTTRVRLSELLENTQSQGLSLYLSNKVTSHSLNHRHGRHMDWENHRITGQPFGFRQHSRSREIALGARVKQVRSSLGLDHSASVVGSSRMMPSTSSLSLSVSG